MSKIEWLRSKLSPGLTINGWVGCSIGCFYCYGKRIAMRKLARCVRCHTYEVHPHLHRLTKLKPGQKPKKILLNSMSDWNDPHAKQYWRDFILDKVKKLSNHTFLILSKRPQEYHNQEFPDNVLLGASDIGHTITKTSSQLCYGNDNNLKFISLEPLTKDPFINGHNWLKGIDWLIVGALTGPDAGRFRPQLQWIEKCIEYAGAHKVPLFIKNNVYELYKDYLPLYVNPKSVLKYKQKEPHLKRIQEFPEVLEW